MKLVTSEVDEAATNLEQGRAGCRDQAAPALSAGQQVQGMLVEVLGKLIVERQSRSWGRLVERFDSERAAVDSTPKPHLLLIHRGWLVSDR